jgi:SAM-dependent methyltransferase
MKETIDHSSMADLYDTYVTVDFDIPFYLQEARRVDGRILELMAGTGRVSVPLIEAGNHLVCVDYSERLLAKLREKLAARGLEGKLYRQDVRELKIDEEFDLAFIAFNSFAELTTRTDQRTALERIGGHLTRNGIFICTLHNPLKRLKNVDGQMRLWGDFHLHDRNGRLLLWGMENYDPDNSLVHGLQFFEEYDHNGGMVSKRMLETKFVIIEKEAFEVMAEAAGFSVGELFGDYSYTAFSQQDSPFMI